MGWREKTHQGLESPKTPAPFERTREQPSTHPTEFYRFGSQNTAGLDDNPPNHMKHFSSSKILRKVTGTLGGGCSIQPLPPSCPELWRQGNVLPQGGEMVGKIPWLSLPETNPKSSLEKEARKPPTSKGSVSKPSIFKAFVNFWGGTSESNR